MPRSNLRIDTFGNAWSYTTQIKAVMPDGTTIGNVTRYSATTSKHQEIIGVAQCHIRVDDIPAGTANLSSYLLNKPHWLDEI